MEWIAENWIALTSAWAMFGAGFVFGALWAARAIEQSQTRRTDDLMWGP